MSHSSTNFLSRAAGGISRRCKEMRNTIEWRAAHAIRNEAPWSQNRWGQRTRLSACPSITTYATATPSVLKVP